MTDLKKLYDDAHDLERFLRLQTFPLAIKLLRSEDEIPADAIRPRRDSGHQYNLCQTFALSRRNGQTIAMLTEDMYCFEPVVGYGMGAVGEIVVDGTTGFVIEPGNEDAMDDAVKRVGTLSREACRKHVEKNFTAQTMVDGYEKAYLRILHSSSKIDKSI